MVYKSMTYQTRCLLGEEEWVDASELPTEMVGNREIANLLQEQYEKAISRRSSYRGNLANHLLSGNAEVWWYGNTRTAVAGIHQNGVFLLSHFCPSNLREGVAAMKALAEIDYPVVAAVPELMANQLEKAGWVRRGMVPQFFDGEIVVKVVMANHATSGSHMQRLTEVFMA